MAIYHRHKALKHRIKVARGSTGKFRRLRKSWKRIEAFIVTSWVVNLYTILELIIN